MNKIIFILSVFLLFLGSCKDDSTSPIIEEDIPDVELPAKLYVQVDPRMELLAVIQHFTTWAKERHTKLKFSYINEINSYFGKFSSHPAVIKSQDLTNYGFNYDAPPTFVLYHNDPPEFKKITDYSDYLVLRGGSETDLNDFADKIRAFSDTSHFMEFFNSHKDYYSEIVKRIKATIGGSINYIELLENYYGETKKSYNIIPTQLFHSGGYGPEVLRSDGTDIYNICGPLSINNDIPYFGDKDYMTGIVLHEFSHSFVNPVSQENAGELNKYSKLFEPIKDKMMQMAYGNWTTCVNEHLVRANTIRFILELNGKEKKDLYLESEYQRGFIYIKEIDKIMEEYESKRDVYKTYSSFYPRILELFKSLM